MDQTLLIIDPAHALSERVEAALRRRFNVDSVSNASDAKQQYELAVVAPDDERAVDACKALIESGKATDVVLLGQAPSLHDAISAIRARASDFVPDGADPEAVLGAIDAVLERRRLRDELQRLNEEPPISDVDSELIGKSDAMQKLRSRLSKIAQSDVTVLITGESGSGKEVVARFLHAHGPRKDGPFVAVGCSAIPRHLIESEFFGYVRGAFTDASGDRVGLLAQATGGTLFLDEIGDMPLDLQAKLLRALQQRSVRPLGSRHEVPFDVRLIAATSRDLEQEVGAGRVRHDLYFRLNVLRVKIPALRERESDVLMLAKHFIERSSSRSRPLRGLTPAAARALLSYAWPGNVRELEHCVLAAVAVARYDHITAADLPETIRGRDGGADEDTTDLVPLSRVERDHILGVLRSVGGNKALASKLLGLDRKTLYRKLKQYEAEGITPPASARSRTN